MKLLLIGFALLLLGAEAWGPYSTQMHERPASEMTRALPTERVTVIHVEAPLSMAKVGPLPGLIADLYHTGLVFYVPSKNVNASIEFDANNFGPGVVIPSLTSATSPIVWDNSAAISQLQGAVDYTYWLKKKTLGTISGARYNMLLEWLDAKQTLQTFSRYYLFQLGDAPTIRNSNTCDDFVLAALRQLEVYQGGPCAVPNDASCDLLPWMGRDVVYRVVKTGTYTKLNASNSTVQKQLFEYYSGLNAEVAKIKMILSKQQLSITALIKDQTGSTGLSTPEELSIKAALQAISNYESQPGQSIIYVGSGNTGGGSGEYYQFTSASPYSVVKYESTNSLSSVFPKTPPPLVFALSDLAKQSASSNTGDTAAIAVLASLLGVVSIGGVIAWKHQRAAANDGEQYSQMGDDGVELRSSHGAV